MLNVSWSLIVANLLLYMLNFESVFISCTSCPLFMWSGVIVFLCRFFNFLGQCSVPSWSHCPVRCMWLTYCVFVLCGQTNIGLDKDRQILSTATAIWFLRRLVHWSDSLLCSALSTLLSQPEKRSPAKAPLTTRGRTSRNGPPTKISAAFDRTSESAMWTSTTTAICSSIWLWCRTRGSSDRGEDSAATSASDARRFVEIWGSGASVEILENEPTPTTLKDRGRSQRTADTAEGPWTQVAAEKRPRSSSFRGDLGKRRSSFRGDLGKRGEAGQSMTRSYGGDEVGGDGDFTKRRYAFRGDLGKRRASFRGDLGKWLGVAPAHWLCAIYGFAGVDE